MKCRLNGKNCREGLAGIQWRELALVGGRFVEWASRKIYARCGKNLGKEVNF